jgi:hypothetical protein
MRTQSLRNLNIVRTSPSDLPRASGESDELLARTDADTKRLFVAAMAGQFVCSFCSHPGPHDDIGHGQGSEIAFACAQCGKHLDESALKRSVDRSRGRPVPDKHGATTCE